MSKTGARIGVSPGLLLSLILSASLLLAPVAAAQTDPGISTTQMAGPATVGQPYTFTVTVTNNSVPQDVGLKDFLPEGMTLLSATPSQGTCGASHHGHNTVECDLGPLPSGGSATVDISATPTVPGNLTNTAVGQGEVSPSTPASTSEALVTVAPGS